MVGETSYFGDAPSVQLMKYFLKVQIVTTYVLTKFQNSAHFFAASFLNSGSL